MAQFDADCNEVGDDTDPCGGVKSRGQLVEILHNAKEHGFPIPEKHIMAMALDLPF